VTNVIFIFETSPNTNLKDEKVWRTWHIISPAVWKSGERRPSCPPTNCAHAPLTVTWY